jgi:hypothetical protein
MRALLFPFGLRRGLQLTRGSVAGALILLLIVAVVGLTLWSRRPQLTGEEIRETIFSTIQREAPAAFLVTGYIEVTAVSRVANTRTFLPGILGLDLGTTSANVRVPGRISYGFNVGDLTPDMIRVFDDGVIEVDVPQPVIFSVEPNLSQMEIETQRGWARLGTATVESVRDQALALVQDALKRQGQAHLQSSSQPGINTADALAAMLQPALIAAGLPDPDLRFRMGRITIEPGRR